jgi:pyridoxamine 5'-phosphate oxidase
LTAGVADLAALRTRFMADGLREQDLPADPHDLFAEWFRVAVDAGVYEPAAMTLATAGLAGGADARMVLLRSHDDRGFVWFTNHESAKARQLAADPRAALVIAWPVLSRQVRVVGEVRRTTTQEDDEYWATRPRGSQIAAIASNQSQVIPDRDVLEARAAELERRYAGREVPRPDNWGGNRLRADAIEFWQGRDFRLHDRHHYARAPDGWTVERLAP